MVIRYFDYNKSVVLLALLSSLFTISTFIHNQHYFVDAIPAAPFTFRAKQPDGTLTPELLLHGDENLNFLTDENGYTIVKNSDGFHVYATTSSQDAQQQKQPVNNHVTTTTGELIPTVIKVGEVDPKSLEELQKGLRPNRKDFLKSYPNRISTIVSCDECRQRRKMLRQKKNADKSRSGKLKNLVVLLRFNDHKDRILPSPQDYDILFNKEGGDPVISPTGSVRDMYKQSSYGTFTIESTVLPSWITLPQTEAYYGGGMHGLGKSLLEALHYALNAIERNGTISLRDFDTDNDGVMDGITFIHSGFGAEWGGPDCWDNTNENRIWSHHRPLNSRMDWCGLVCMKSYQIVSGLWGKCGVEIGRIGVVGHELGHFLGLSDMYDTNGGGRGIGSFGLMGECWGFDGSQRYPPPMDAWSKIKLGWLQPDVLSKSGIYSIEAVIDTPKACIIKLGFPPGEYLLIENRYREGLDGILPTQGGLLIWHVDERANYQSEGFPGQDGWPFNNGMHYKVAVVQADGLYSLEKGANGGDGGDLYQGDGVNFLGPSNSTESGPFPNTDSYQYGVLRQTGVEIRDISKSGKVMSFTLIFPNSPFPEPSVNPSPTPAASNAPSFSSR